MNIPKKVHILGFSKREYEAKLSEKEIKRIGRIPEVFWNIRSKWDDFCMSHLRSTAQGYIRNRADVFSCTRGHYHMLQVALDMGEQSYWGLEPDERFLKDVSIVNNALDLAPKDADILILDAVYADPADNVQSCIESSKSAKDGWWKINSEDVRSAGSYILSRRAMEKLVANLSRGAIGKRFWCCDQYWRNCWFKEFDAKIYVANPMLCVQAVDPNGGHISNYDKTNKKYELAGVDFSKYQEW